MGLGLGMGFVGARQRCNFSGMEKGPDPLTFWKGGWTPTFCDHLVPKYKKSECCSEIYNETIHCVVQTEQ